MGINNAMGRDGTYETTSTMVLKNEFKKMMRDTRIENMKILKVSYNVVAFRSHYAKLSYLCRRNKKNEGD